MKYASLVELIECAEILSGTAGKSTKKDIMLEDALKEVERNPASAVVLGTALSKEGKFDDAILVFKKVVELGLADASYHRMVGGVLESYGNLAGAVSAYSAAVELAPKDRYYYHALGNALVNQGKLEEAAAVFINAAELFPKDPAPRAYLGVIRQEQGRFDEAKKHYKIAASLGDIAAPVSLAFLEGRK